MNGSDRRGRRPRLVVLVLWAVAIGGYLVFARSRGLSAVEAADNLRSLLADNPWGAVVFIVAYVLRPVVLFPASVLTVLGGLAFGLWWGTVLTIAASNMSTAVNYSVGRFFALSRWGGGTGALGRAIDRAIDRPFETTLIMRLIALPFDAVAYVAGFARLRFWPFLAGSALGTLAGTVAFVAFGASVESLDEGTPSIDARLVAVSVVLTVGGILVARWLRSRDPLGSDPATSSPEVTS